MNPSADERSKRQRLGSRRELDSSAITTVDAVVQDEHGPHTADKQPVVELRGVGKSYAGVYAVRDVSFAIERGSVLALVGENGAGKSTLVKILTGAIHPDEGQILVDGKEVSIHDPRAGQALGIAAMYQEPRVFPDLSVVESIFAGHHPRNRFGMVDWRGASSQVQRVLDRLGVDFGPDTPVRGLGVADRQLLEIAKALISEARLLIMDEPTAVLSPKEVENLFGVVEQIRAGGAAVVFISHRLEEVYALADTITVLRDGRLIETRRATSFSREDLIHSMVGRPLNTLFPKQTAQLGEVVLSVRHLNREGVFSDISFELRRGEIVGLAGFVGAGRTEVARSIFGLDPHDGGQMELAGAPFAPRSPKESVERGIALVPEDRLQFGLVHDMSIAKNVSMASLADVSPGGFMRPRRERVLADSYIHDLRIKAQSSEQPVRSLSGGNQQKVVLSKWLAAKPKVLILDEPTQGIDVGAKADVHRTISELAARGLAILLISSELPEVMGMSDRIIVLSEGRIAGEFTREEFTQEKFVSAATGDGR